MVLYFSLSCHSWATAFELNGNANKWLGIVHLHEMNQPEKKWLTRYHVCLILLVMWCRLDNHDMRSQPFSIQTYTYMTTAQLRWPLKGATCFRETVVQPSPACERFVLWRSPLVSRAPGIIPEHLYFITAVAQQSVCVSRRLHLFLLLFLHLIKRQHNINSLDSDLVWLLCKGFAKAMEFLSAWHCQLNIDK